MYSNCLLNTGSKKKKNGLVCETFMKDRNTHRIQLKYIRDSDNKLSYKIINATIEFSDLNYPQFALK